MKLMFTKLPQNNGNIKISFDGGQTWESYEIDAIRDTGIPLADDQDYSLIKIKGTASILKDIEVLSGVNIAVDSLNVITPENTTYSLEETPTGKTWINGKPIYRKVCVATEEANTYKTSLPVPGWELQDFEQVISYSFAGTWTHWDSGGSSYNHPPVYLTEGATGSPSVLFWRSEYDRVKQGSIVILEYTKTTDTATGTVTVNISLE